MTHPQDRGARRRINRLRPDSHLSRSQQIERYGVEKNWKHLYGRSVKLRRAQQLGKLWPHREWEKLMADADPVNVLFVCSKNQWRSPTGEAIFAKVDGVATRSAGTATSARRPVSLDDIRWADLILVMEDKHAARLKADFRQDIRFKKLHVLDIPDDYKFMEGELVNRIRAAAEPLIFGKR
jgi:predicted protein tyrosine phosphatase